MRFAFASFDYLLERMREEISIAQPSRADCQVGRESGIVLTRHKKERESERERN